jgi:PAS domain S-box-containing protein
VPRGELLNALIESIGEGLYVVTAGGAIDFVNRAGLHVLGYDDERELLGRPSHQTIHAHRRDGSPYPEAECPLLRPRETGESVEVDDDWFVRRDGTMVPVAYTSAPFETPDGRGAVVVFRDTTERRSRRRILEAADAERRRLGRDLHDGAQQRLVNVVIALQMAMEGGDPLVAQALEEARAAIEDLRELGAGLHPSILTNRGLRGAITALTARAPLPVTFDVPDVRLDASIEAACYFVVAEALTNVAKHAEATEAHVEIAVDDHVTVVISDDGRGGAVLEGSSIQDRVAAFGGTLEVRSSPGEGTTLRAAIPL